MHRLSNFAIHLEDHLISSGFDTRSLNSLLDFVEAPEELIELARVVENFTHVLPHLRSLSRYYSDWSEPIGFQEWTTICQAILKLPNLNDWMRSYSPTEIMPLRGYYDSNKIYVALWERPLSPLNKLTYSPLLAHCLIAVDVLKHRMKASEESGNGDSDYLNYKNSIYHSLLFMRKTARSPIPQLPSLILPPRSLLDILNEKTGEDFHPIRLLYRYLLNLHRPPSMIARGGGGGETHPAAAAATPPAPPEAPPRWEIIGPNPDPDQEGTSVEINLHQVPLLSSEAQTDTEDVGCSAEEVRSGVEFVAPRAFARSREAFTTAAQKAIFARQAKSVLAMQNQRLPYRWEVLTLYEVSTFLSALADLIRRSAQSAYCPQDAAALELSALMVTSFWMGQRIEGAMRFWILTGRAKGSPSQPGFVLDGRDTGHWRIIPATPARARFPVGSQVEQAVTTARHFSLNSGIGVEPLVCKYIEEVQRKRSTRLFSRPIDTYTEWASAFLSAVNRRHHTRLTQNRVSDYLFDRVSCQDGSDVTAAMYIFGREHFLGRSPSYYTSYPVARLQAIYREACRNVRDKHLMERPRPPRRQAAPATIPAATAPSVNVGSPYRPRRETVQKLVQNLQEAFQTTKAKSPASNKLEALHNSMFRYTACMVAFATGFRAIRDPFLAAAEIDWETGFAALSDKDNEDRYNSRLIWIPPVCLEQLSLLRESELNDRLRMLQKFPRLLRQAGRCRRKQSDLSPYFARVPKGQPAEIWPATPYNIQRTMREIYALPFNSSRHYLRSNLLERGCPVEVVHAFMGHFERGEEPWGTFSGLSPLAYRNALETTLVPLLEEDGWKAIPGLGVRL